MWKKQNEIKQLLERKIASLENDYQRAFYKIPNIQFSPFPIALYALANLDFFSGLWAGWNDPKFKEKNGHIKNQTERMVKYLLLYFKYPELESKLLVTVFRHKLIHTSDPSILYGDSNQIYTWAISPKNTYHMQLRYEDDTNRLHFGIENYIYDLNNAIFGKGNYFDHLLSSYQLQDKCIKCLKEMESYKFIP